MTTATTATADQQPEQELTIMELLAELKKQKPESMSNIRMGIPEELGQVIKDFQVAFKAAFNTRKPTKEQTIWLLMHRGMAAIKAETSSLTSQAELQKQAIS